MNEEFFEFEDLESVSLGSPINFKEFTGLNVKIEGFEWDNFNSNANFTYSPSQDTLYGPHSGFVSNTAQMSKQVMDAILMERKSFVMRCDDIRKEISLMISQLE